MALIRTQHEHQTSKPPRVQRDPKTDRVEIAFGAVEITMSTADAADLARRLTAATS